VTCLKSLLLLNLIWMDATTNFVTSLFPQGLPWWLHQLPL
jgi:hypothetical protein